MILSRIQHVANYSVSAGASASSEVSTSSDVSVFVVSATASPLSAQQAFLHCSSLHSPVAAALSQQAAVVAVALSQQDAVVAVALSQQLSLLVALDADAQQAGSIVAAAAVSQVPLLQQQLPTSQPPDWQIGQSQLTQHAPDSEAVLPPGWNV